MSSSCTYFGRYDPDLAEKHLCPSCDPVIHKLCMEETRQRKEQEALLAAAPKCFGNHGQPIPGMTCGGCAWDASCMAGQSITRAEAAASRTIKSSQ